MVNLLVGLSNQLLLGACCFSIILVFLSLAALLRLLPVLLNAIRLGLRAILILSYRLYALVLTRVAPRVEEQLGIDILTGIPRLVATVLLSLVLGLSFVALSHLPLTGWIWVLLVFHGLAVGLAWDEIAQPGGLQLGGRVQ